MTETELCGTGSFDAVGFALGLRVRDVVHHPDRKRDGERAVWFYGLSDTSWAVVVFQMVGGARPSGHHPVRADGGR